MILYKLKNVLYTLKRAQNKTRVAIIASLILPILRCVGARLQ